MKKILIIIRNVLAFLFVFCFFLVLFLLIAFKVGNLTIEYKKSTKVNKPYEQSNQTENTQSIAEKTKIKK